MVQRHRDVCLFGARGSPRSQGILVCFGKYLDASRWARSHAAAGGLFSARADLLHSVPAFVDLCPQFVAKKTASGSTECWDFSLGSLSSQKEAGSRSPWFLSAFRFCDFWFRSFKAVGGETKTSGGVCQISLSAWP